MEHYVKVFAPATISNVGPGFDLLGFAVEAPADIMIVRTNSNNSFKIINNTNYNIPEDPEKNVATVAVASFLKTVGIKQGFDFIFQTKIAPGSGIGSSAASSAAAVVGVNILLNNICNYNELLTFALEGEKLASGSIHADNIAPALLGGFILIRNYDPLDIIQIKYPENLFCIVAHPELEIMTLESRKLIPKEFPIKNMLEQCGNIAALIAGLNTSDFALIGRALNDVVAEPVRAISIPGYYKLKEKLTENGALGGNISGAGPSVFALAACKADADKVASFMRNFFDDQNINNRVYVTRISSKGTRMID